MHDPSSSLNITVVAVREDRQQVCSRFLIVEVDTEMDPLVTHFIPRRGFPYRLVSISVEFSSRSELRKECLSDTEGSSCLSDRSAQRDYRVIT